MGLVDYAVLNYLDVVSFGFNVVGRWMRTPHMGFWMSAHDVEVDDALGDEVIVREVEVVLVEATENTGLVVLGEKVERDVALSCAFVDEEDILPRALSPNDSGANGAHADGKFSRVTGYLFSSQTIMY